MPIGAPPREKGPVKVRCGWWICESSNGIGVKMLIQVLSYIFIYYLDFMYVGTVNNISDSSPNEETSSLHFQLSKMIFIDELQE